MKHENWLIENEHSYRKWTSDSSERYYSFTLECYIDEYGNVHENQEDYY